jgi:hypothetical protein
MFVLALAVAGAIAVVHTASRNAVNARAKTIAEELARTALADAAYTAEGLREASGGRLAFAYNKPDDVLGPAGFQRSGWRGTVDRSYGWLWRAHSYNPALGIYSLDVWVYANPDGSGVVWSPANDVERGKAVLYLRSALESRR